MSDTKKFTTYNFVTGAIDGTLAYDFGRPVYYPEEEPVYEAPPAREMPETEQEWVREREQVRERSREAARTGQGVSPLALLGVAAVVVILVMTLLVQVRLMGISQNAVELENQIRTLEAERDRLTVEYETVFNLKDVEEYAVGVLGMQEPRDDQVYYLTDVSSADHAVVISNSETDIFSFGLEDLLSSVKAYFS